MKIMNGFLAKRFILNLSLVLFVVCGVIFAISFMEYIASMPTFADALDSSLLHFLEVFPMFLPLAVFIGTLLTFHKLLLSSELVIIQSSGWSSYKIMRPMLFVSVILGIITIIVINPLSTRYSARELKNSRIEKIDNAAWLREKTNEGSLIIRAMNIKNMENNGLAFIKASIIKQNSSHQIIERIDADSLLLNDRKFTAKNALILDSKGLERKGNVNIATNLSPESIIRQYLKPNQISFWKLPDFIKNLKMMGIPVAMHLLQFLTLLFLPFVLLAMTVLGAAFSQTRQRRKISISKHFGFGIITCFVVYFIIQIFNSIGSAGAMSPFLAVAFPPAIVLFFAATVIIKSDNI
ncbi:MAG: LptF/LptG family permease [Rickettsiales bacterium]|nr:LptF/LptG family permease [Rickettsiales bacterium]